MVYIPDDHLPNLSHHQFKSTGYSILDLFLNKFIWEPIVRVLPRWLAPNLVTVIGMLFMMASYFIMLPFDDTFLKPIPENFLYAAAFCQFMYQTLDACDGKHARNLKLASPLGMLLDHGCDSLSCTFFMLAVMQGMGLGLDWKVFVIYSTVFTGFYLTHWEEYHTHYHRTHMFNWGVTEGQWTNIAILTLSGYFTKSLWSTDVFGMQLKDWLIFGNSGIGIILAIFVIFNTLYKSPGIVPFFRLMPLIMQNISLYLWFNNVEIFQKFAPCILITHGLIYGEVCSKLIISSAAKLKFRWFHLNVFLELLLVLELSFIQRLPPVTSLYIFVLVSVSNYTSFVCSIISQLSTFLNISVFKVKTQ
jgi:phosphatidylglycerophosphate synthase